MCNPVENVYWDGVLLYMYMHALKISTNNYTCDGSMVCSQVARRSTSLFL